MLAVIKNRYYRWPRAGEQKIKTSWSSLVMEPVLINSGETLLSFKESVIYVRYMLAGKSYKSLDRFLL